MTISIAQFRADFPEFTSSTSYPASQINFWLGIAYKLLNASRWGNLLDTGAELFIAHNLAIEARAGAETQGGGIPGQNTGPVSSKSVDKVSISYDTGSACMPDAGHWNLTVYGTRFVSLMRMMGAGPIQVGIGVMPPGSGLAWPGPLTTPGFTNFGN